MLKLLNPFYFIKKHSLFLLFLIVFHPLVFSKSKAVSLVLNPISLDLKAKSSPFLKNITEYSFLYDITSYDIIKHTDSTAFQKIKSDSITIQHQAKEIDTINQRISNQISWIEKLRKENELQSKKLEDRIAIEKELEHIIKLQLDSIKIKNSFLAKQHQDIEDKQSILSKNDSEITKLKLLNYLLVALVLIILIASYGIYRIYKSKKALVGILKLKNALIYKQSKTLASQNKELEQFAYITSHDLKEPLNTISGLIMLLLDEYKDKLDEDGKTSLNYINDSSIRMKTLIDSVLEYSRLGKTKDFTLVDTNILIKNLKADLGSMIYKSNAEITVQDLPTVLGAEIELRLLFQNLISNGIKFTDKNKKPSIHVSSKIVEKDEQFYWQFAIQDYGIGIPKEYKDKIFAIFQRLHSQDDYEGTGIGLAHCKKIVESHGGTIWLESEEGKGSTFFFTIPKT